MPFTPIDDVYGEFGKIKSKELSAQLKTSIDLITEMIPAGQICPIMVNIPGVPAPDPNIWQECNGSEITNPNSPLRSLPGQPRYTPDLRDRFLRITKTLGQVGFTGGVNSYAGFGHRHTIGMHTNFLKVVDTDADDQLSTALNHNHAMSDALLSTYNFEPLHRIVKFFMKIQ